MDRCRKCKAWLRMGQLFYCDRCCRAIWAQAAREGR